MEFDALEELVAAETDANWPKIYIDTAWWNPRGFQAGSGP